MSFNTAELFENKATDLIVGYYVDNEDDSYILTEHPNIISIIKTNSELSNSYNSIQADRIIYNINRDMCIGSRLLDRNGYIYLFSKLKLLNKAFLMKNCPAWFEDRTRVRKDIKEREKKKLEELIKLNDDNVLKIKNLEELLKLK